MTRIENNKQTGWLIHVIAWVFILVSPFLFFPHHSGFGLFNYLCGLFDPLLLGVMFYLNYLWLARRYFVEQRYMAFFLINIVCIVGLGIFMEQGNHFLFNLQFHDELAAAGTHSPATPSTGDMVLFYIRGMILLLLAAAFGTLIRISLYWTKAEERRREAELGETEAKLQNLQNQVNPHFLLNTLNNIYVLTEVDKHKAQDAIMQLSALLRHLLYKSNAHKVPLQDEIEFIKNYISLMQIRMGDSVEIHTQFSAPDADNILVAPHLFICLIENAFKHGINPNGRSHISISISTEKDAQIVCDIRNSNHPKPPTDRSGSGIGLSLVQQRLDLVYPRRYIWTHGVKDGEYRSLLRLQADTISAVSGA